jgi:hypothetical protein
MKVRFVKGHCGWDALTLIPSGEVPPERELEAALKTVDAPVNGGLEAGFLGRGSHPGEIRMRMVSSTQRGWIPMCGGMTQVVGKALVETFFREHFGIDATQPRVNVDLSTGSGVIPLEIDTEGGRTVRTTTVMDGYAAFLYERGVAPVVLEGIEAIDTSEFLVFDVAALERAHPGVEFRSRRPGAGLQIVHGLLKAYRRHRGATAGVSGMMYERGGEGRGQFRVYPRFYSDDEAAAQVPFEFQCGTGTIAVGLALAHQGLLPFTASGGRVIFEWGSRRVTPDPYGIRTSRLEGTIENGRVARARFSHSVVEILAEGTMMLPGY